MLIVGAIEQTILTVSSQSGDPAVWLLQYDLEIATINSFHSWLAERS